MGPFSCTDPVVKDTLTAWFNQAGELVVEHYLPHSGGSGFFFALATFSDFEDLIANAKAGSICFVLRDLQLPIRGKVTDALISEALGQIADGKNYLIAKPSRYPTQLEVVADGKNHAQLRTDLEKLRGEGIWVGPDFEMPSEYWHENTATDALIAVKCNAE
jgi:hypothetical protein